MYIQMEYVSTIFSELKIFLERRDMAKELAFYSGKKSVQAMYNNYHFTLDMKSII